MSNVDIFFIKEITLIYTDFLSVGRKRKVKSIYIQIFFRFRNFSLIERLFMQFRRKPQKNLNT